MFSILYAGSDLREQDIAFLKIGIAAADRAEWPDFRSPDY
jgi:hypothetical protein